MINLSQGFFFMEVKKAKHQRLLVNCCSIRWRNLDSLIFPMYLRWPCLKGRYVWIQKRANWNCAGRWALGTFAVYRDKRRKRDFCGQQNIGWKMFWWIYYFSAKISSFISLATIHLLLDNAMTISYVLIGIYRKKFQPVLAMLYFCPSQSGFLLHEETVIKAHPALSLFAVWLVERYFLVRYNWPYTAVVSTIFFLNYITAAIFSYFCCRVMWPLHKQRFSNYWNIFLIIKFTILIDINHMNNLPIVDAEISIEPIGTSDTKSYFCQ